MSPPWRMKVALALGGGAARGLAHVGVVRALVREGIPIDLVAGTSMGSLIGGAYAATRDITGLEERIREFVDSDEFKKNRLSFLKETKRQRGGLLFSVAKLIRRGIVYGVSTVRGTFMSAQRFAQHMAAVLPDVRIEEMPIPFGAVALDIESAEEVLLCRGRVREVVSASSAIPGLLPPVRFNERLLVDGGWVDKVPVLPAYRMGADLVIAVDISAEIEDTEDYSRGLDVMLRANAIKDVALVRLQTRLASVVLEPEVKGVHWADFSAIDRCIEAGDRAATEAAPRIRKLLKRERFLSLFRPTLAKKLARFYLDARAVRFCVE